MPKMEENMTTPGERYKGRRRPLCDNVHAVLLPIFGGSLDVSNVVRRAPEVRTRLYTSKDEKQVTAEDVVYALLCFARGETSSSVANRFRKARMTGLSRATLENYAKRVLEANPEDVPALLKACTPPGRYDHTLSRTLVERLEACTKTSAAPRSKARWRTWTLLEITFFVRTGKWPPRAVWEALPRNPDLGDPPTFRMWQDYTREIGSESGSKRRTKPDAKPRAKRNSQRSAEETTKERAKEREKLLRHWGALQAYARSEKLDLEHKPLAPEATREAVRVALLSGARPQENVQERGGPRASTKKDATNPRVKDDSALSRTIIEQYFKACTKAFATSRSKARRREWTLLELTYLVRTGKWPPRVVWAALPSNRNAAPPPRPRQWNAFTQEICGESGEEPGAEHAREWEELQASARSEKLDFEHEPLAPEATLEDVRVALSPSRKRRDFGASLRRPEWKDKRGRGRPKKSV
jgi:hypothetical protein